MDTLLVSVTYLVTYLPVRYFLFGRKLFTINTFIVTDIGVNGVNLQHI